MPDTAALERELTARSGVMGVLRRLKLIPDAPPVAGPRTQPNDGPEQPPQTWRDALAHPLEALYELGRGALDPMGGTDPHSTFSPFAAGGAILGAAVPVLTGAKALTAGRAATETAATAPMTEELLKRSPGIKAYHGSPHDFDKFSLSKIGTGEGAQAYGHGLYFAEDQKVANTYRGKVSAMQGGKPTVDGRPINWDDPREGAAFELWRHNGDRQAAADFAERTLKKGSKVPEILRSGDPLPDVKPPGRMYEVNLKVDPNTLLDWDKSLADQSPAVIEKLRTAIDKKYGRGTFDTMAQNGADPKDLVSNFDDMPTGGMEALLGSHGVPGVKYLDGVSRGAKMGTRNYVIFDDALVDILKKYGVAGAAIETLRRKAAGNGGKLPGADVQQAMTGGQM